VWGGGPLQIPDYLSCENSDVSCSKSALVRRNVREKVDHTSRKGEKGKISGSKKGRAPMRAGWKRDRRRDCARTEGIAVD